jgi:hypothetical protein
VLETGKKELEKDLALCSQLQLGLAHRTVRWGTGQRPVRQDGPREEAALRTRRRRTTIIHRTVRWRTGLSGESSAANSSLSGNGKGDVVIIHWTVRWCTRLSGDPTVACANGRPRNLRATRGSYNGRQGAPDYPVVHRTVSGAPTGPELQRSSVPDLEGNRAPDRLQDLSSAPLEQKARIAFLVGLQLLLAALGL